MKMLRNFATITSIIFLAASCHTEVVKPNLIKAVDRIGAGAVTLNFHDDKSVTFIPGMMSSSENGTYTLKDSLVIIKGIAHGHFIKTDSFIISKKTFPQSRWKGKLLYPFKKADTSNVPEEVMLIVEDWRDSTSPKR